MKTLNLVYPEKSDIKYEIQKFPDGQQNVKITYIQGSDDEQIVLKSRLNNWSDLEVLVCTVLALRKITEKPLFGFETSTPRKIHLYVPYFLGARSDRAFCKWENNYLKEVVCPIINSLKFTSVTVLDPHSNVLEACLNDFVGLDNEQVVKESIRSIYSEIHESYPLSKLMEEKCVLISPDAGATHKIHKLASRLGYSGDIITCTKERSTDGKLSKVYVPLTNSHIGKDLIIIDDICDGGTTFINIAKDINERFAKERNNKLYLIVTHGIFSKGFEELDQYFDGIYCTNSYKDLSISPYSMFSRNLYEGRWKEGTGGHRSVETSTFVKQLDVFS